MRRFPLRGRVPGILALTAILTSAGAATVQAQLKCYIKKCVEYEDGSRVCERTPVDCATIE